ncbi:potassium channel family protein [bacterium]|nr:potassium channel family protein [bacterium]
MINSIKHWVNRLKSSSVAQTVIGFVSFLIIASVMMLFLESSGDSSGIKDLFNSLWFSIVTITTVGYGDISPTTSFGKIAAVVIMFIGIIYIGVLTANITSWLVERNRRRVLGLVPIRKMENHFLVLGWRQGMDILLKNILALHNIESNSIVLINTADAKEVSDLRQDPLLKNINYFSGDFTSKAVMQNVCGNTASRVLIISEELPNKTTDEIDFRTVLATIAIKHINPQIYAIVEIIQPKFSLYLQHVEVEEIILNRFCARALLSNIALMSGLNSVFSKLFSMKEGVLKIQAVESKFVGKTYRELKQNVENYLVIGLIENTGNLRKKKQEKMELVGRSVSIKMAIQRLSEVKTMKSNIPIFHPSPSYVIKKNSSLIVLDTHPGFLNTEEFSKETVVLDEIISQPVEEYLAVTLRKSIEKTKNWDTLLKLLGNLNIDLYIYGNRVNGVIYNNQKYPFASLKLTKKETDIIEDLFSKKGMTKDTIRLRFHVSLEKSADWDEFFERLRREGIDFYQYRKNITGLVVDGKKFSFKILDIDDDIAKEINNYKGAKSKARYQGKAKDIEMDYRNLADLKNDLKIKKTTIRPSFATDTRILMICGWKPQLIEMLNFIVSQYSKHQPEWNKISIVANISDEIAERLESNFNGNVSLEIHQGEIVDREMLKKAGITKAVKVMILAETESRKSFEEIDSQTVLAAMLVGGLNKKAYRVAEILDNRYKESLVNANVEEIYLEDEFTRIMLSYGSHGMGMSRVVSGIVNIDKTVLKLNLIDEQYINTSFKHLLKDFSAPGELIIGLLEEAGNVYARKSEKIQQAQIQSNIKEQVDELRKVKELVPNHVVIAPPLHYKITPNSKLIILNTTDTEGWNTHQTLLV